MPSIARTWRITLDGFYHFREWLTTLITFLSLHLYASEITWSQIKKGKIKSPVQVNLKLDDAKELDLLLSEVKCRLAEAEKRRDTTTDKCKSLVTLSSLVLAASGIVVSKANLNSTWTQLMLVLAALLLIHVVILISMHFAVSADTHPTIDQHDASLSGDDLRKSLINTYLKCQADRNERVNFLVELYKGARFYFLLGLTLIIVLLVATLSAPPKKDLSSTVAKQLSENAPFIENLYQRIESIDNIRRPTDPKLDSAVNPAVEPQTNVNPPPPSEPPRPADVTTKTPDKKKGQSQMPPSTTNPTDGTQK